MSESNSINRASFGSAALPGREAGNRRTRLYALMSAFLWFGVPCALLLSIGVPEKFVYPPFVCLLVAFFYLSGHVRSRTLSLMLFNCDSETIQNQDRHSVEYAAIEKAVPSEAVQEQDSHSVEYGAAEKAVRPDTSKKEAIPRAAAEGLPSPSCKAAIRLICEYLEGRLAPKVAAVVQRHLDECANCRTVFDAAALTLEVYYAREKDEESKPKSRGRRAPDS